MAISWGRADASPARVYSEEDDPKRLLAVADKLDEAIEAYQQERPDEAIRLFQQVLTQRPGVATAYVYLAYVLRDQQRLDEAVLVLRAAIDHGVDTPSVRGLLGNYLQRLGQLPESVSILERLVRDHPEALEEREGLALSYAMMGRLEEARELFESILLVAPDHDRARLYLGEVFFELGRQDAAEESFRRVAETGRELRAEAWAGLGNVEALRGRREQAIDAWRRAVSLGYSDADTIFRLGIALAEVGQTQEAESRLAAFLAMTRVGDDFGAARAKAQALVNDLRRRPISAAP